MPLFYSMRRSSTTFLHKKKNNLGNNVTRRSLHLIVFWILFENVMSLHRTKATFVGLFDLNRVNEWIVTEKLGDALKRKLNKFGKSRGTMKFGER